VVILRDKLLKACLRVCPLRQSQSRGSIESEH
jgi:hypothetical protein